MNKLMYKEKLFEFNDINVDDYLQYDDENNHLVVKILSKSFDINYKECCFKSLFVYYKSPVKKPNYYYNYSLKDFNLLGWEIVDDQELINKYNKMLTFQ